MTSSFLPPDGSEDRTEPYGPRSLWAGTPASAEAPDAQPPSAQPRRRGRAARWAIAGILAAALLGGGLIAAADITTTPVAASAPSGPTGQAAALSAMLSSAGSPGSTAGTALTTAASAQARHALRARFLARCSRLAAWLRRSGHPRAARAVRLTCARRLVRLRLIGGLHGQFTFRTQRGIRTLAFERGAIQSVTGGAVVVRASDGTTWTWDLISRTIVREDGKRAGVSALAGGQHVFLGGPVRAGARDARLIVILPAGGGGG